MHEAPHRTAKIKWERVYRIENGNIFRVRIPLPMLCIYNRPRGAQTLIPKIRLEWPGFLARSLPTNHKLNNKCDRQTAKKQTNIYFSNLLKKRLGRKTYSMRKTIFFILYHRRHTFWVNDQKWCTHTANTIKPDNWGIHVIYILYQIIQGQSYETIRQMVAPSRLRYYNFFCGGDCIIVFCCTEQICEDATMKGFKRLLLHVLLEC